MYSKNLPSAAKAGVFTPPTARLKPCLSKPLSGHSDSAGCRDTVFRRLSGQSNSEAALTAGQPLDISLLDENVLRTLRAGDDAMFQLEQAARAGDAADDDQGIDDDQRPAMG